MELDQLIRSIGAAAAMAESQNGCLFPCLTKSEWASWVQAIGSIVALGVAIAVPYYLDKKNANRKTDGEKFRARLFLTKTFANIEVSKKHLESSLKEFNVGSKEIGKDYNTDGSGAPNQIRATRFSAANKIFNKIKLPSEDDLLHVSYISVPVAEYARFLILRFERFRAFADFEKPDKNTADKMIKEYNGLIADVIMLEEKFKKDLGIDRAPSR